MSIITLRPGDSVTVIAPVPQPPGPVDPGYGIDVGTGPVRPSHPIYYPPSGGGGPVDPGYSPPWAQLPVDPGYGVDIGTGPVRPTHPIVLPPSVPPTPEHPWVPPSGPVDPGYFPPGIVAPPNAPDGGGNWCWAWLPGVGWRWVRIPGKGEAGPK